MIHTDGRATIANAVDVETEILHMKREKLSRELAACYGMTLEQAREAIVRAATIPPHALSDTLTSDDTALD